MGAGKSAVGRALARALELGFVDADVELEHRLGVDLGLVFEREGEDGFRRREAALLDELTQRDRLVLATGGGAVLSEANRRHLRERGRVVFLDADLTTQLARTRRTAHRPLLQTGDPAARLAELYAHREPLYRALAHHHVSTTGRSVAAVVADLQRLLA
jgi:shikimate kinase